MTKKITVQIDCCRNCIFCKKEGGYYCVYAMVLLEGEPYRLHDVRVIDANCPLSDATPDDDLPAPISYERDAEGYGEVVVHLD